MDGLYIKEGKRKVKAKKVVCLGCSEPFLKSVRNCRRSVRHFCSRKCLGVYNTIPKKLCKCDFCFKEFMRNPNSFKKSKSGLLFCSRKCKDKSQRMDGVGNIPKHYGTSNNPRIIGGRCLDVKCVDCGVNFKPILEIHHIDGDPTNNSVGNLEWVCATHHKIRHMVKIDNEWCYTPKQLTPRECIQLILKECGI